MTDIEFKTETKALVRTIWKGKPLPLSPFEGELLKKLCDTGKVRFDDFPEKSRMSKAVAVSNIRKVLHEYALPFCVPQGWHAAEWILEKSNGQKAAQEAA
jgi:hypothetical protein